MAEKCIQDQGFRDGINAIVGYEVVKYTKGSEVTEVMEDLAKDMDKFRATFTELINNYRY